MKKLIVLLLLSLLVGGYAFTNSIFQAWVTALPGCDATCISVQSDRVLYSLIAAFICGVAFVVTTVRLIKRLNKRAHLAP